MTPLEQLQQRVNANNQATGRLAGLDEHYARANALRDKPMTGPDQYGQLSPLQAIADVLGNEQGRKQVRELAPQRTAARADIARTASALPMYKAQVDADAVAQGQKNFETVEGNKISAAGLLAKAKAKAESDKAAAVANARGAPETWITRDGKESYTGFPTDKGFMTESGLKDITKLIPYKEYSVATRALTKARGKDGSAMDKVGSPDLVTQVLDSPDLEAATGTFDPSRWAGKFGLDAGDIPFVGNPDELSGERVQALHSKMSDIGINSVKTNLKGLGINPTDKDLEVAFASIPDAGTQPYAWGVWARDQYLPMLKKAGSQAILDGTATPEAVAGYLEKVEASVNGTMDRYGPQAGEGVLKFDDAEEAEYQAWKASQTR